jgi:hypothetical protein
MIMRVAVAILFVLATCVILALQVSQCTAVQAGNTTGDQSGNNTYLDQSVTVGNSTDMVDRTANMIYTNESEITSLIENPPGYGAITGVILSSVDSHAVPEATVTLYDEDGNLVDVPENPQLSSNGIGNNAGIYTFTDVPLGIYNVTAEKGGISFFAIVDLSSGTATANVVLPEYVETEPAYMPPQAPSPTPRAFIYFLPIRVGKTPASGSPGEGLPFGLATIGGIFALLLFTRRNGKA